MELSELLEHLRELDCASIADADKSLEVMDPALRPVKPGLKLVGVARTVSCHEDFLAVIDALNDSVEGEVLVVDTNASQRAVVGELFSIEASRRGLAGIVVDGPVRDVQTIRSLSMPVYARSYCPVSGTTQEIGEQQIPVKCGGVTVNPGDIVFGDDDGILVANIETFSALIEQASSIQRIESEIRNRLAAGECLLDMLNADEHLDARKQGRVSTLQFVVGND